MIQPYFQNTQPQSGGGLDASPLASRDLVLLCFAGLLIFSFVSSLQSAAAGAGLEQGEVAIPEKKSLKRRYDAVVIRGERVQPMLDEPISGLRLYAVRDGHPVPIPFQVDERNPDGEYVLSSGPQATEDVDKGIFDYNDELVFLADDTGDRTPKVDAALAGIRTWTEIQVTDPLAQSQRAWVYLCSFSGQPPPPSGRDYIRYLPKTEQIYTDHYGLGYRKGMSLYSDLFFPNGAGGYGPDVLDRIKVRIKVKFMFNVIHVNKSEDDFRAEVVSWKDGPVRVLRNVQNYVRILFRLSSASVFSVTEYYPWYMYTPLRLTIPFDLKWVFSKFGISDWYWYFYGDLPGLDGGTMYTNWNQQGILIDAVRPPSWYQERADLSHLLWGFVTKEGLGTWFCNMVLPDCTYQFAKCYLNIDRAGEYPPEDVRGELAGGAIMNFKDVDSGLWSFMAPGTYTLGLETFFAPGGLKPEGVPEWTNIREFPIQAEVRRCQSPPAAGAEVAESKVDPGLCRKGQAAIMSDLQGKETRLFDVKLHIGDMRATGWGYTIGQDIGTGDWSRISFDKIRSLKYTLGPRDPVTGMEHPMISRVNLWDGSRVDLLSCKSCILSGLREDGKKQGYLSTEISEIKFLEPGEACQEVGGAAVP